MRAITWDITLESATAKYQITPLGDVHLGARACQEKELQQTVDRIAAEDNHYWIGMGDLTDGIGRNCGDKRSDEENLASWLWGENRIFERQRERLLTYLKPIAGKCLGMLQGNHEQKVLQYSGQDMFYSVAAALQKEASHEVNLALGYAGFVRLRFRRDSKARPSKGGKSSIPITIYASHGYGGGRKAGGKANKLTDMAVVSDADLYLFGHVHAPELVTKESRMSLNQSGKVVNRVYTGVITGTYLAGYVNNDITYSERFGFQEVAIGSPTVIIHPCATDPGALIRVTI